MRGGCENLLSVPLAQVQRGIHILSKLSLSLLEKARCQAIDQKERQQIVTLHTRGGESGSQGEMGV